jgi:trans-aconitate 2-methyltransferase
LPDKGQPEQTAETSWNPEQYQKFQDFRLRPAIELLDRIPLESPRVIYDLGCGTGNVTRIIADRWSSAKVYGLDSSMEMLGKAQTEHGGIHWIKTDINTWIPDETPDLIYSNATLHWVEGHHDFFPRLARYVRRGGCLAFQMPLSWDAVSHRLMREILADCDGAGRSLGTQEFRQAVTRKRVKDPEFYYDLLAGCVSSIDIWATEYLHKLEGEDPVLEWVKGTSLRPVLKGLPENELEIFLAEYRRRLGDAYPQMPDGRTLYPFKRLFIVANV